VNTQLGGRRGGERGMAVEGRDERGKSDGERQVVEGMDSPSIGRMYMSFKIMITSSLGGIYIKKKKTGINSKLENKNTKYYLYNTPKLNSLT
jgi:hypothetical protein